MIDCRDQELRFTVHDSPDYYKLKISIFSEDKRTDLIGETWVDLTDVITPKGGKLDLWQGLSYKGKYAGELRIEITYYDSRPKIEGAPESVAGSEDFRQSPGSGSGRVKRRPLPSTSSASYATADTIQGPAMPGRAKHGPRDLRMPARANSMPPETTTFSQQQAEFETPPPQHAYDSSSMVPMEQAPPSQHYGYDNYQEPAHHHEAYNEPEQPDFLPQLPPSDRPRGYQQPAQRFAAPRPQPAHPAHPHAHMSLQHSHSAPIVPQTMHATPDYDDGFQLQTDYPEPIPDLDYQHQQLTSRHRGDAGPDWQSNYNDAYAEPISTGYDEPAPPPPPMHSNSAPVVPLYGSARRTPMSSSPVQPAPTPPHGRHHSVPSSSPLQIMERGYNSPQRTPVHGHVTRGNSVDGYMSSPQGTPYDGPPIHYQPRHTPSPVVRPQPTRPLPHRKSIADPYQTTLPRPHPLSQEVPRPRSPLPPLPAPSPHSAGPSPYQQDFHRQDPGPPGHPRALSPRPPAVPSQSESALRPRSSYSIQHPVRAFESSDNSPLSTSRPPPLSLQTSQRSTPARKSISPFPSAPGSAAGGTPFSPDSFDAYNPQAQQATLPESNSPYSPYHVPAGSASAPRGTPSGPIVGWHGQEIDPSDHLPVDSWAPEPEKKIPTKTYGLGRDRDFGPRTGGNPSSGGRNVAKDTVVNFRVKSQPLPLPHAEPESPSRNRLQKKPSPGNTRISPSEPLRERHNFNSVSVPDPYAQQEYSRGFYGGGGDGAGGGSGAGSPGYGSNVYGNNYGNAPDDTLAREISNIDIGGSGRSSRGAGGYGQGAVPAPTAYQPVRSHRDRNSFY